MPYMFISYSHKDKEYAHRLEQELKQRGFEVWLDDRIDYGSQWPRTIEKKLEGCGALILIMTGHSYDSEWVQNELTRAKRKKKDIFPLLLEGDEPWLSVEATQYVDVRGGNLPPTDFYDTLGKVVPSKDVEIKPPEKTLLPAPKLKITGSLSLQMWSLEWTIILGASGYILEKSTDPTFKDAIEVYKGRNTSYSLAWGLKRFLFIKEYYRVKAKGGFFYWDSSWSNVVEIKPYPKIRGII